MGRIRAEDISPVEVDKQRFIVRMLGYQRSKSAATKLVASFSFTTPASRQEVAVCEVVAVVVFRDRSVDFLA